jgi:2-keto-4-pentenoate hydratase
MDGEPSTLSAAEVAELARHLLTARRSGRTIPALTQSRPLRLDDAYRIQAELVAARLAAGERRIGWKLGYTSRAMREQMGVDAPNFGPLTDAMLLPDGGRVPSTALQPRVEPEIAVVLGPGVDALTDTVARQGVPPAGRADEPWLLPAVAEAVDALYAALEVVDSVWTGYQFRLEDNTADGSSAAWFVLGPQLPTEHPESVRVELESASSPLQSGTGADADGHPLRGVAWLAARLHERGDRLQVGDIVITGGLTRAVPLDGQVRARFSSPSGERVEVCVLPA